MKIIQTLTHPVNRVLLTEDNQLAQMAATIVLTSFDLEVDVAASGEEAIELSQINTYDLILMDIGLGDMSGFEVVEKIRQQSSLNQHTAILALTAHSDVEYEQQAIESGMQGYLVKPISAAMLEILLKKEQGSGHYV